MRQMKFINAFGDITFEWNDEDDNKMRKFIQNKIDEGYIFYIVKSFCGIKYGSKKVTSIKDIKSNKVQIKDKDVKDFFESMNTAKVIEADSESYDVVKSSSDPDEIINNSTVVTKPPTAG